MHTPVLLKEAVDALSVRRGGKYIDATYGEGGHSQEIARSGGAVLAIEWDDTKIKNSKLVWGNFKDIEKIAKENKFAPVDGVLFDLGLSMEQLKDGGRGFSYKKNDEPLDMRINSNLKVKASDIVNSYKLEELYDTLTRNSEEVDSWAIAHAIVKTRRIKKIMTVGEIIDVLKKMGKGESAFRRIFQALRIEVNDEFDNLKKGLKGAKSILNSKGRIVVISFHSLEDRIVKKFIKSENMKLITPAVVRSKSNLKFERSAILRAFSI